MITNQTPSNKVDEMKFKEEKEKSKKWPTNAKWVISMLLLFVALLIVWILESFVIEGDKLLTALVDFSTILSVFLSVSSIAFAGYTSIETGRQFHYMSRAVEEIRTLNRIMSDNYKNLLDHYHDTVNKFSEILEHHSYASNKTETRNLNVDDINNTIGGNVSNGAI